MVSATKKPGRPATGVGTPVQVRFQPKELADIDAWIEEDGARFSRPEAVRVLIRHALGKTAMSRSVKSLPPHLTPLDD